MYVRFKRGWILFGMKHSEVWDSGWFCHLHWPMAVPWTRYTLVDSLTVMFSLISNNIMHEIRYEKSLSL